MRFKLYMFAMFISLSGCHLSVLHLGNTCQQVFYSVARKTTQTGQIHVYRTVSFSNASYERHTKTHEWECELLTHINGIGRIETSIEQTRTDPQRQTASKTFICFEKS